MTILTKEERADFRKEVEFFDEFVPESHVMLVHNDDVLRFLDTIDALEAERDALRSILAEIHTYATQQASTYVETHQGRVLRRVAEMAGGGAVHTRRPESSVPPPTVQIRRDNEGDRGGGE